MYHEEGLNFLDKLEIFRDSFKSAKDSEHRGRLEGAVDPKLIKAITDAINGRYQMSFYYRGDKENVAGWRVIQPYVYGLVKGTGNQVLRAYLVSGKSYSHHFPKWRLYRLDRIINYTSNTNQIFLKAKPLYNYFWDRGMTQRFVWWKKPKA